MHSSNDDVLQDHHLFLISEERLAEVVENNLNHTRPFDGLVDIVSALQTNIETGIIGDQRDLYLRHKAFGSNLRSLQNPSASPMKRRSLRRVVVEAFKNTTILLLLCCSVLSLIIGIKTNGLAEAIMEGSLVFLAVSFVVTFGVTFRFFRARWMMKKSLMRKKKFIRVVRSGKHYQVSESELVVGDVVCLQMGDCVPADGIFIHGDSLTINGGSDDQIKNCSSLFAGAEVVNGHGRMLVTSVGEKTERSRLLRSIVIHDDPKPHLLDAIDEHSSKLEKVWLSFSLIFLMAQLVRCFVWKPVQTDKDRNLDPKGLKNTMEDFMKESIRLMKDERSSKTNGFVAMLCVLFIATRDGLPFAIFILLLYASHKMKSCGAAIQNLPASATIGLITTICTAKTSDLVLHHQNMADLWIGFKLVDDFQRQVDNGVLDILQEGIFVHSSSNHGCLEDMSLITWARAVLSLSHGAHSIVRSEASDLDRDLSCSIVKRDHDNKVLHHVHWKGAPELILSMCSHYYTVDGKIETLDDNKRLVFLQIVHTLVACTQSCFAFAYKQDIQEDEEEERPIKELEHDLTLIGFVGLKNPYSLEVREAIEDCLKSGVSIKLMVEDDINTARIMALNCGLLLTEDDHQKSIVDAADFRTSSEEERMNMMENIHVVANASPEDKLLMVQCLKKKGETVAATTTSIRDSPMLGEADVGIFMGDECPDLFKEDGDILFLNKTFSQIPGIVGLGKGVCETLEIFIQLQLTLEISTFAINIISVAVNSKVELSSFQVLWINLILETLGALAVAIITIHTDRTGSRNSKQVVYGSSDAVITRSMCRSILVQSLFQVTIVMILEMKGRAVFQAKESVLKTIIFNCYALCQVFLLITAIDFKKREKVVNSRSCLFFATVAIIGILQAPVVEIIGAVAHSSRLDIKQWCICIGIASFSLPLASAVNWIPITPKSWGSYINM